MPPIPSAHWSRLSHLPLPPENLRRDRRSDAELAKELMVTTDRSTTWDTPWDPLAHETAKVSGTRVAETILCRRHPMPRDRRYGCKRYGSEPRSLAKSGAVQI